MSNATIDRLLAEKADREAFVKNLLNGAESEERALTDSEVANIEAAKERLAQITGQVKPLIEWEEQRTAAAEFEGRVQAQTKKAVQVRQTDILPFEGRSLGQAFVESPEFRSARDGITRERFNADITLGELTRAATVLNTGADPGKMFLQTPQKYVDPNPIYSPRLWDLVNHMAIDSHAIEILTYGTYAGGVAADVVAEMGQKPPEELKSGLSTVTLETIAGYVEVTRQLLQLGGNAVRNWIDGELVRSIMYKVESQIATLLGSATAVTGAAGVPVMGVIRQAQAVLQTKGYNPNAVLANPADLAALDQDIFQSGYMVPNVQSSYWGLRPVASPVIPAGTVVVADWDRYITVFERTGISVYSSDSGIVTTPGASNVGKDRFTTNTFVILAEIMCKAAVVHADAAVKVVATSP